MDYRKRITVEPAKRGGKPCIPALIPTNAPPNGYGAVATSRNRSYRLSSRRTEGWFSFRLGSPMD